MTTVADAALEAQGVTVRFGGNTALDETTVTARPGCVTGLIGPNGAGKTTLFNVVTGLQGPNSGRVLLDGHDVTRLPPHKRARRGLARTFQRLELFTSLSVRDNVRVGGDIHNRWSRGRTGTAPTADDVLELIGLSDLADREVSEIPTGQARVVELAAGAHDPARRPAARRARGRPERRRDRRLRPPAAPVGRRRPGGLLVEHDMTLVMDVCETIHVLDYGRMIAIGPPDQVRSDPAVVEAYLGTPEGVA